MNYPRHIEQKLGFDKIREYTRNRCLSTLGASYVEKVKFSSNASHVRKWLLQVHEFKQVLSSDSPFPIDHFIDARPYLKKLDLIGNFLLEEEFFHIRLTLGTFEQILNYLEQRKTVYPQLAELIEGLQFNVALQRAIDEVIDKEGRVKPHATPELRKISSDIADTERSLRRIAESILKKAREEGWVSDTGITLREGRWVLPVLAEHKRKIKGFVHDESATGQTYYIEPAEVVEINNSLRELYLARKREIERILIALTEEIRPYLPDLIACYHLLSVLDFIRAKALLAIELGGNMPLVSAGPHIGFRNAFHPLLHMHLRAHGKQVVPMSLHLDKQHRILVVSGPNAGGKSVAMKTTGLLQYMIQCGYLPSMEADSTAGIFEQLFIDIGDEQSIENDLSTYSSHLRNMKHFVQYADDKTLVMIDEFGSGTDPQFGGPMAESILDWLNEKKVFGFITTHFSNIKLFATHTTGVINGAMLFDNEQLEPRYILEVGRPGSSYAFEIARQIGLNRKIIEQAKDRAGRQQQNMDELLLQVEKEKLQVERLRNDFEKKNRSLEGLLEHNKRQKEELEQSKKQILNQAKTEAAALLTQTNREIEETIRQIRESAAEKEKTKELRQGLQHTRERLKKELAQQPQPVQDTSAFKVGDFVKIKGGSSVGEIISIDKQQATLAMGELRTNVKLNKLEKASSEERKNAVKRNVKGVDFNTKLVQFSSELDVRGQRGEDALALVNRFIDDALVLGFEKVKIIHGKGDGILRKLIRDNLKRIPQVAGVSDEAIEMGGDGATLVILD